MRKKQGFTQHDQAVTLLRRGLSIRDTAKELGRSYSYVWKINRDMEAEQQLDAHEVSPAEEQLPLPFTDVSAVLDERGSKYGSFVEHARITQNIKQAMADSPNWATLPADTREAFEMVAHKLGRALNGDPEYTDNIIDMIGYLQLVLDRMEGRPR